MIKNATKLLIAFVFFSCTAIFGDEKQEALALSKGYVRMAGNIIKSAKDDYPANSLVNAIVRRNIADVDKSIEAIDWWSQSINEVYELNIESSGFEDTIFDGELQEKMLSSQTCLSLALLNSIFDSTPEEKNRSLCIIKRLLDVAASNVSLSNSYFIQDKDGSIRDFEEDVSVVGWMILCGCREEIFRLVLDFNLLLNADTSVYTLYKKLAEDNGRLDVAKLIDEYSQKQSAQKQWVVANSPRKQVIVPNHKKPKSSTENIKLVSQLFDLCLTKNTVLKNNLNSMLSFGWN